MHAHTFIKITMQETTKTVRILSYTTITTTTPTTTATIPAATITTSLAVSPLRYTGYKEARLVADKKGIAFVEFNDE